MSNPLQSLPLELLFTIVTHLPPPSLAALTTVSHYFSTSLTPTLRRLAVGHDNGVPALNYAARIASLPLISTLLQLGANPYPSDATGSTGPLHVAARLGHAPIIASLLPYVKPDVLNLGYNRAPLVHAAAEGHVDCVALLLTALENTSALGDWTGSENAVQVAADAGHDEVVKLFLARCPPDQDSLGFILKGPARNGWTRVCRELLKAGADPEAMPATWRPLHSAAKMGHVGVVRVLLEYYAEPDAVSLTRRDLPQTPMLLAARAAVFGWKEEREGRGEWTAEEEEQWREKRARCELIIEMLLEKGADVELCLHLLSNFPGPPEGRKAVEAKVREIQGRWDRRHEEGGREGY